MRLYINLIMILTLFSCDHDMEHGKMDGDTKKEKVSKSNFSKNLKDYETFQIYHYNGFTARVHKLDCSDGNMILYCDDDKPKYKIATEEEKNELVSLIERFYIKKTDDIILSQMISDVIVASNYSSMEIRIKNSGSALIAERTQFGSEQYNIVYNPEFVKLFELVQRLTSPCKEKNIK